jgi:hypothetical protein
MALFDSLIFDARAKVEAKATLQPITPTQARDSLYEKFRSRIIHNPDLDRTLVSFQANKITPFYSWFKYKEGFSQRLVEYLLGKLWTKAPGVLLDPFAGAGAALFEARAEGWATIGIEVLPVGAYAMQARFIASRVDVPDFEQAVTQVLQADLASYYDESFALQHIAITKGAFRKHDEAELIGYISYCKRQVANNDVRNLLLFAAFTILEEISYTRKDGQYLRWDYRSGRSQGKKIFDKGHIRTFREAIKAKLLMMLSHLKGETEQPKLFEMEDISLRAQPGPESELLEGSCLDLLPTMESESIDFVLTSPPYANRYDYTRTYALELVYLGCDHEDVKRLRQAMLSCTVENKDKQAQLEKYYASLGRLADFKLINRTLERQEALQEVLGILDHYRDEGKLNNDNVSRLVRNYFYEMCFVIYELSRLLRPGGIVAMVNDNVRYAGEEVPVDIILSDIAQSFGMKTSHIWTLGRGKGNSSQQMGNHGRSELRKCVYVWVKA